MSGILIAHIVFAALLILLIVACIILAIYDNDIAAGVSIGAAIGCFIFTLPLGFASAGSQESYNRVKFEKIVSIERSAEATGHFALGFGTIDSKEYYYFYVDHGFNKYKLERLAYNETYIIEDNTKTPSVYETKEAGQEIVYNIYVPEGTIVKEFHL